MNLPQSLPDFIQADIPEIPKAQGAWSFSALMNFEQCPYKYFVENRLKQRGPTNPAMERGSKIHEEIENYIQAKTNDKPSDPKIQAWAPEFELLRQMYIDGNNIEIEEDWAFTADWETTGWTAENVWLRSKLDFMHHHDNTSAHIADWKSGRKFGNELKHQQQGILYAISAFMRYPELQFVKVEFLYVDQPYRTNLEQTYTREQAMMFVDGFTKRANKVLTAELNDFAPPLTLDGLPVYLQKWLRDPANYGHDKNPFDPPYYVTKV